MTTTEMQDIDPNERKYTPQEVVQKNLIGYKMRTVKEFLRTGRLRGHCMRMAGQNKVRWLIPESAISEFLKENQVAATRSSGELFTAKKGNAKAKKKGKL